MGAKKDDTGGNRSKEQEWPRQRRENDITDVFGTTTVAGRIVRERHRIRKKI